MAPSGTETIRINCFSPGVSGRSPVITQISQVRADILCALLLVIDPEAKGNPDGSHKVHEHSPGANTPKLPHLQNTVDCPTP